VREHRNFVQGIGNELLPAEPPGSRS
jgi:hypothetical protein